MVITRAQQQILHTLGVPASTYLAALVLFRGDADRALRDVLENVVDDAAKSLEARRLAAVHLVTLEPDRGMRDVWQRTAVALEMAALRARGVRTVEAAFDGDDCSSCSARARAVLGCDDLQWHADFPPPACPKLDRGALCQIFFVIRDQDGRSRRERPATLT